MYYLVDLLENDGVTSPALLGSVCYLVLASPPEPVEYAICRVQSPLKTSSRLRRIPARLSLLLACAEQYGPAMALMQKEMSETPVSSQQEFLASVAECLKRHLETQATAPYFLAKSNWTQEYHIYADCYYWIVGYDPINPERAVKWVSEDYWIFHDPIEAFAVDADWLKARFAVS